MSNSKPQAIRCRADRFVSGCPVYYGWVIATVGLLGFILSGPGQTFIISLFTEHFIRDLGLSRSLVSTLYMVGTLSGAILLQLTRMGKHIDRRGPRTMMVIISLVFGLSCTYMSLISSAAMLAAGFIALRFLGQSSMTLVASTMVNQWWIRYRGRIRGIMGVASSLILLSLLPILTKSLISTVGWRLTYVVFGCALVLIMVPVGYLAYRRRPEDFGLEPDGRANRMGNEGAEGIRSAGEVHFTLREEIRTPAFWVTALSMGVMSMVSTGLIFHMESVVTDQGLASSMAAIIFAPMGMTQAILRFPAGYLVDRVQPKYVLAVALFAQASTVIMATKLSSPTQAYAYGVVLGITSVAWGACGAVIWAKYYGRHHLGSISSVALSVAIVGSSLGPMLMGVGRDLLGSYRAFMPITALLPIGFALVGLFVRVPRKPQEWSLGSSPLS